ncbi:vWA domain-containing protein [Vibrio agarivorans]|uniref:vWA domain-containing protein n=1 Tax=Vibrio agarivorans TaxID=153622 RepID=UPI00222E4908|nr:VWA domain-containing protein [Vibrio agarivorans]
MLVQWWSSIELTYPYWLLALPLPALMFWLAPVYRTKQVAIKVPFFQQLIAATGDKPSEGASELKPQWWQRIILTVSWVLVVLALTKPIILGEPQLKESIGRDLMFAVDLSGSMDERDFTDSQGSKITRLEATKQVLKTFVEEREGDRLGLILFGDAAFLQAPFTADKRVWLELLNQSEVGMAGQSTHLGDAIGLAIKVFNDQNDSAQTDDKQQVVIVLTDGNDTGSFVEPIEAAKVANAKNVRIHIIAVGDPQTVGETAIDMQVIKRIALESGGEAFQALDRNQLTQAYQVIDDLEPELYESMVYYPKISIHHYLINTILAMYLCAFSFVILSRHLRKPLHGEVPHD